MKIYVLAWHYGTNHCTVETTENEFKKVVALMSQEFEIHQEKTEFELNHDFDYTKYYFYNYYGDEETLGFVYDSEKAFE